MGSPEHRVERGPGFLVGAEQSKEGGGPQVSAPKALLRLGYLGLVGGPHRHWQSSRGCA